MTTLQAPAATPRANARQARSRLIAGLGLAAVLLLLLGLATGSAGWSMAAWQSDWGGSDTRWLITEIRAPRSLGALLVGALLGLAGALAQGVFRNPLADPFLLGSAAGASLAVVLVLAGSSVLGHVIPLGATAWMDRVGLVGAAFAGALIGVLLTLALARGAQQTLRLLLAGVVVGALLGAVNDLLSTLSPEALRGRQMFLLGSTGYLGWSAVAVLAAGLLAALPIARRSARVLDALTLGDDSAASLGLALGRWRLALVVLMALCTGLAVAYAGLIGFVGLAAPHLVKRMAPGPHAYLLGASALAGGVLLLAADVLARAVIAPMELPVGIITAIVGGSYLLVMLSRRVVR